MTQYFTDFGEYTVDVSPLDWTRQFGTRSFTVRADAGATGGQLLELSGAADFDFISWDAINGDGNRDDSEVLFKFRVVGLGSEVRALQRGVNNTGREGYILGARPDTGSINSSYLQAGVFNDLTSSTQPTFVTNTWYWCSSVVRGTAQNLTFWEDGSPRPETPSLTNNDTTLSAAGWVGLYSNRADTVEVDIFSVGTGVDDAPESSVSSVTISTSPSTAFPGQSRTVTGTNFGATQGTGGLTIGGVTQTITSWSDTEIIFTAVLGTNSYETDEVLEITSDTAETVATTISFTADTAGGFGVANFLDNPSTTDDSSVAFNTTPAVETGDQFEWEDFNALGNLVINAQGFVEHVDTEGVFRGRFWDATDSTWGSVAEFTAEQDISIPTITSVNVPNADTYAIGEVLNFTVNWSETVNITGTPQLQLTVGASTVQADYSSGSGSTATIFAYTIAEGDVDNDGVAVVSLGLNGGTIRDTSSNAADLTLNGVENTAGVLVDGIRPVLTVDDLTTTDTTPIVSGTCDDAVSLTLVVDGVTYNPVPSGGTWSQQLNELT